MRNKLKLSFSVATVMKNAYTLAENISLISFVLPFFDKFLRVINIYLKCRFFLSHHEHEVGFLLSLKLTQVRDVIILKNCVKKVIRVNEKVPRFLIGILPDQGRQELLIFRLVCITLSLPHLQNRVIAEI